MQPVYGTILLDRLADYKVPRQLHLVDALPRNEAGKVLKRELPRLPPNHPTTPEPNPMSTDRPTILTEQIGAVCRITLGRPEQHNPLTPRCIRELLGAVAEAEADYDTGPS